MRSSNSQRVACAAAGLLLAAACFGEADKAAQRIERNVYFGDLHIHTRNSLDAYMFRAKATPDDAYRYAKGFAIEHTLGQAIQLRGHPLDFAAVTDHGELLGLLDAMADPDNPASKLPRADGIRSNDRVIRLRAFRGLLRESAESGSASTRKYQHVIRSAWQQTIEAAERHNDPGVFTTFVAYEYSSAPENQNLHRNVIFGSADVPEQPFSAIESDNPEDLWHWLDAQREKGMPVLAIPHNSNVSNGLMFEQSDWVGNALDAEYAELRMRNEPLVEIVQVKGTSETHPSLSPNDEWANFELYDTLIASDVVARKPGGFVRDAYRKGLVFQQQSGFNPYAFGLIGSSDTHNAGGSIEEDNFTGKVGAFDGTPPLRGSVPDSIPARFGSADATKTFTQWSAAGLAGIWAEENSRESLFAAMQRRETFATSGPRIPIRLFASYDFSDALLNDADMVQTAYSLGVPMGATLSGDKGRVPAFLVWTARDSKSALLQRLQIIKGWVANGGSHEQVFDVACSGGLLPDPDSHRCPDNGALVNLADCSLDLKAGSTELKTLWRDPYFDPDQQAFYYARVLENPTCRWSTWDAIRAGAEPKKDLPASIQERAWSSPIWYRP